MQGELILVSHGLLGHLGLYRIHQCKVKPYYVFANTDPHKVIMIALHY